MDEIDVGSKKKNEVKTTTNLHSKNQTKYYPVSSPKQQKQQHQEQQQLRGSDEDYDPEDEVLKKKEMIEMVETSEQKIEAKEQNDLRDSISGVLKQSYGRIEDGVKFSLGKLFANSDDVSEEDMETIAKEVSSRLEERAEHDLIDKGNKIVKEKEEELEQLAEETGDVNDVEVEGEIIIIDMDSEIKEAAEETVTSLKKKSLEIEKEVIKE